MAKIDEIVEGFSTSFTKVLFRKNDIIYHIGSESRELFIVESGQLGLILEESRGTKVIETLLPGTMVGELEMFSGKMRISSLVALTEATCWILSKKSFEFVAQKNPALALKFVSDICLPFDTVRYYNTVHHWSQLR